MTKIHVLADTLKQMKTVAAQELADALGSHVERAIEEWPVYERESSFLQTVKLGAGDDCNYDRPTVGLAYACWYMPRRINDAFHFLISELTSHQGSSVTILDLGCGTGATWWACRYISQAMIANDLTPPSIHIIACDTSLPMLNLGKQMWDVLDPATKTNISIQTQLTSWTNIPEIPTSAVIFASYLFDQSDKFRIGELAKTLGRMAYLCSASRVYLAGASNKRLITAECVNTFLATDRSWSKREFKSEQNIWSGLIPQLHDHRVKFAKDCTGLTETYSKNKLPTWSDDLTDFVFLERVQLNQTRGKRLPINKFILDAKQESAAIPDGRLSVILGAAGSGKSRVLVERIVRTIIDDLDKNPPDGEYLVTCFNVEVVMQLKRWFMERLKSDVSIARKFLAVDLGERVTIRDTQLKLPTNSPTNRALDDFTNLAQINFLTWDAVISRRFDVGHIAPSPESEKVMKKIIENWGNRDSKRQKWLNENTWVTPKFVLQELKRVIYGQSAITLRDYLNITRRGRPSTPGMSEQRRRGIWDLLKGEDRVKIWIDRRIAALRKILEGFQPIRYHRVFLDECQDFVEADFRLLTSLVNDPRNIVVSGDGTQALQTGPGYFRPRTVGNARWVTHELSGSYRLPIRICEAIEPIATAIQHLRRKQAGQPHSLDEEGEDIALPRAVKNAVIGCRPIVMAPKNSETFVAQISAILQFVGPLVEVGETKVLTNADMSNHGVARLLNDALQIKNLDFVIENNSMLKIKGLERSCIFFSTRIDGSLTPGASIYEWLYTILTRSTSVLIICLSPSTKTETQALIGRLRKDCLMFWDNFAEVRFNEFASAVGSDKDPFRDQHHQLQITS